MKKFLLFCCLLVLFINPVKALDEFDGLGINNIRVSCNASAMNCTFSDFDKSLYSVPSTFTSGADAYFGTAPVGWTFNVNYKSIFEPGYIYTIDITLFDNASTLQYLRTWSIGLMTGSGNYTFTNAYADLLSTEITKNGSNFTYTIKFKAKSNFDYLRVSARAPYNFGSDKVYSDVTTIDTTLFYNSLKRSGTYQFGIQSYVISYIEDKEASNIKQNQTIIDQNTEAEKTRKGIWGTIKDVFNSIVQLPSKLVNLLIDALKSLFIPSDDFFENFINDFKDKFLNKLGFLAYPFELIADILDRYMNVASDPVINIPQINEPFTGGKLIEATSVNLKEIFEYGAIGTMYGIYRSCVSVIIIVMFLNFAIKKYDEFVKNKGSDS